MSAGHVWLDVFLFYLLYFWVALTYPIAFKAGAHSKKSEGAAPRFFIRVENRTRWHDRLEIWYDRLGPFVAFLIFLVVYALLAALTLFMLGGFGVLPVDVVYELDAHDGLVAFTAVVLALVFGFALGRESVK
jgi:hypothetical protein